MHRAPARCRARGFAALLSLSLLLPLAGCPDDVASTDLAQQKDQGAQAQDLAGRD